MKLQIFSILSVVLCWYLYQPVPDGVSWKLRAIGTSYKLMADSAWLADRLNIGKFHDIMNWMLNGEGSSDARIQSLEFDGVKVRTYNVENHTVGKQHPALVYYHGGGWMISHPEDHDNMMLAILDELDIVIISVDYRLADGKIKFPVPLDDCVIATKYLITHADQFNVDPERVAIGGDSAGGNLAAAVALRLRDEMFQPRPKLQVLIYPMLQAIDFALPSMVQYADGAISTRFYAAWCCSMYAMGHPEYAKVFASNQHTSPEVKQSLSKSYIRHEYIDEAFKDAPPDTLEYGDTALWGQIEDIMLNPYFAPLLADNLRDLPAAYVYTSEGDPLHDDGVLYVKRLRDANVPVTHVNEKVSIHGVFSLQGTDENEKCMHDLIQFLENNV